MNNCRDIENLLPLYAEGILSEAEKRAVAEHLSGCAACQRELACLQKAGKLVDDLSSVEEPPWFQQKIMARVREEARKKSFAKKWFYPLRMKIPVQVTAAIVIAVLAVYIYRSGDEQVKDILPGVQKPAVEMQKEQAPAMTPQAGDQAVLPMPRKKAAVREEIKQSKQVTGGKAASDSPQKIEVRESKLDRASEADAYAVKGLAESKDKAYPALQAKQNEMESLKTQVADREEKADDRASPGTAKKKESNKMAAPAAPRSMASSVSVPLPIRLVLRVDDLNAATAEVEKLLAGYNARKVTKQLTEGRVMIGAEVPGKAWNEVLAKLKTIGRVEEKITHAESRERMIIVTIEISGRQ